MYLIKGTESDAVHEQENRAMATSFCTIESCIQKTVKTCGSTLCSVIVVAVLLSLVSGSLYAGADYDDLNYSKGTFFGGPTNDSYLLHVAVDKYGNVYGTGFARDIQTTAGAYQTVLHGPYDIMVFKLDPTLTNLIWATYIGGSSYEGAGSIAVDDSGQVYLSGYTMSADFPITVSSDASNLSATPCVFALKLSADGSQLLYSRALGRTTNITQQTQNASKGAQLCVDPSGNAYILSQNSSGSYTTTTNAFQGTKSGGIDMVVTKLDPTGTVLYSSFLGGSSDDLAGEIIFAKGSVFCTGSTNSADFPAAGGKSPQGMDAFVLRLDAVGALIPAKSIFLGGSSADNGMALCYDAHADRIAMTGTAASVDFPVTASLMQGNKQGGFLAAFDPGLNSTLFVTSISSGVTPTSIIPRKGNSSFFISGFASGNIPLTANAYQSTRKGSLDGVMFSVDSAGSTLRYGTFIGGSNSDYSTAKVLLVERECALRVIFGITTHSTDFPVSRDSYQPNKGNGGEDQPALVLFSELPVDPVLATTTKLCSAEMTFKVSVDCPPLGVIWNFGDGGETVGFGPVKHTYSHNGKFMATITLIYPEPDTMVLKREVEIISVPDSVRTQHVYYPCSKDTNMRLYAYNCVRYEWSPGAELSDSTSPNPRVLHPHNGKYFVHGWDAHGCESFDTVQVYLIDFKAKVLRDTIICRGASVNLQAFGGSAYQWYPPTGLNVTNKSSVIASPTTTTTYHVVVTDGSCPDTVSVTVRVQDPPKIRFLDSPALCPGAAVQLHVDVEGDTTGLRYEWQAQSGLDDLHDAAPTVHPSKNTTYKVRVISPLGCESRDSVKVRVVNSVKAQAKSSNVVCSGESVRLQASGGAEYEWQPPIDLDNPSSPQPLCTPSQNRNYTVYVRSGTCVDSAKVQVRVNERPTLELSGTLRCCAGDSVSLHVVDPNSALRYQWIGIDNPAAVYDTLVWVRPLRDSTYRVRALNGSGCEVEDSIRVQVDSVMEVHASGDTTMCAGGTATLKVVANATSIHWEPNDGVFDAASGIYTVSPLRSTRYIVTAQRGSCVGTDTVDVSIRELQSLQLAFSSTPCRGFAAEMRVLNPEAGLSYHWEPAALLLNADGTVVQTIGMIADQSFHCRAELGDCSAEADIKVPVHELPRIKVSGDTAVCALQPAQIHLNATALQGVEWSPSTGLSDIHSTDPIVRVESAQQYVAVVTDTNGCVDSVRWNIDIYRSHSVLISVRSVEQYSGNSIAVIVRAHADTSYETALSFDLGIDKDALLSTSILPSYTRDGRNYWRVSIPRIELRSDDQEVLRVQGTLGVPENAVSRLSIDSASVDWAMCADLSIIEADLTVDGCANSMRRVVHISEMGVLIASQPVETEAHVILSSASESTAQLQLLNFVGELLEQKEVAVHAGSQTQVIDMRSYAAGPYVLRVKSTQGRVDYPFVKY